MLTSCAHCVFRVSDENNKQTGCYLNKTDLFVKTEQEGSFLLEGLCFTSKNCYWDKFKEGKTQEQYKNDLLKECGLSYAIFIDINDRIDIQEIFNLITELKKVKIKPYKTYLLIHKDCKYIGVLRDYIKLQDKNVVLNISLKKKLYFDKASEVKYVKASHYFFLRWTSRADKVVKFLNKTNEDFALLQLSPTLLQQRDRKDKHNMLVNKVLYNLFRYEKNPEKEIIEYVKSNSNYSKLQ